MTTTAPPAGAAATSPEPVDLVTLTIDGIEVSVPKGTLVIRAAEQIGISIPRFCDHPLLDPVGACRQCLVEVATPGPDGQLRPMPKPQASCTMAVTAGMEVKTQHTSAGGRQGPARGHGVPPHQPPARLPGLRQGRRVPAAEPGDEQRPRRRRASRTSSGPTPSRSTSPARCCSTASAASCAPAAPGSRTRSPATRSSRSSSAARSSRSASTRSSPSSPTSPATPSRSARSAR